MKKHILFLCTGNSARSQMAEGLVNHFLGEEWEASSAGTAPSGYVHPLAVKAMSELGADISSQESKSVETLRGTDFDVVITVCDNAAQNCPVWLGGGHVKHMGFPDPAAVTGGEEEQMEAFRQVRDGLRQKVFDYLENMEESSKGGTYAPRNL
jgi:arsenate reductase